MHRADRIVVPEAGDAVEGDHAGLGGGIEGLDGLHDRRRRQLAVENGADEIEPRHLGHHLQRGHAVFDGGGGLIAHGVGSRIYNDDHHTINGTEAPATRRRSADVISKTSSFEPSSPGLTGRPSTPRLLGLSLASLEYWITRFRG